jgi:hypothetical protein
MLVNAFVVVVVADSFDGIHPQSCRCLCIPFALSPVQQLGCAGAEWRESLPEADSACQPCHAAMYKEWARARACFQAAVRETIETIQPEQI